MSESKHTHSNGLTQKEMLLMVLEGQEKINERIDQYKDVKTGV
jgi:hypothetical protein